MDSTNFLSINSTITMVIIMMEGKKKINAKSRIFVNNRFVCVCVQM